jgi:NADP-dependent 3-hydroxy acid dehydrogenase YdfG
VTGRRPEPIKAVAAEIGGLAVAGDTSDDEHLAAAISEAVAHFGGLDIVIASAGIILSDEVLTLKDSDWQQMLDINLTGAMKVARAALPALMRRGYCQYLIRRRTCRLAAERKLRGEQSRPAGPNPVNGL